jgi:hypothetical protein
MTVSSADRVVVFDARLWGGRDVGDNSQFWKSATIIRTYWDCDGNLLADVQFDHDDRVSYGHFVDVMRDV